MFPIKMLALITLTIYIFFPFGENICSARDYCLFDTHVHTSKDFVPLDDLISRLKGAGISRLILFGSVEDLQEAVNSYPEIVFPFVALPRDPVTKEVVINDTSVAFIRDQLDTGIFHGIGELPLRHRKYRVSPPDGDNNPVDQPILLEIYDLAATYGVPVNVHVDDRNDYTDELENALAHNRNTRFIWSHAGEALPLKIRDMMRRNSNLYADISNRNRLYERQYPIEEQAITNEDGSIKEEWQQLFEEFPKRFFFGSDVGASPDKLEIIDQVTAHYQAILSHLQPSIAKGIAFLNMKRLLGLDDPLAQAIISMQILSRTPLAKASCVCFDINSDGKICFEDVIFVIQKAAELRP